MNKTVLSIVIGVILFFGGFYLGSRVDRYRTRDIVAETTYHSFAGNMAACTNGVETSMLRYAIMGSEDDKEQALVGLSTCSNYLQRYGPVVSDEIRSIALGEVNLFLSQYEEVVKEVLAREDKIKTGLLIVNSADSSPALKAKIRTELSEEMLVQIGSLKEAKKFIEHIHMLLNRSW